MKKLIIFLTVIGVGAGIFWYSRKPEPAPEVVALSPSIQQVHGVTTAKRTSFSPQKLRIPKIAVDADIEYVGLDEEKRMDVPKDDFNVAWYKNGAVPGERGSAVLAGHFDTRTGSQAVFYRLSELESGDTVIVEGENGEEKTFTVTNSQVFKDETFPVSLVFSQNDAERLNLITCDGVFDENQKNYSDRLVVFTKLKKVN